MKTHRVVSSIVVLVLTLAAGSYSAHALADNYPLEDKLKQCEMAFKKAHSGDMSQADAAKARKEHMELVQDILQNLNKKNAEITAAGGELSQKEVLNNLTVMGRLLEMLAIDHHAPQTDWSYVY